MHCRASRYPPCLSLVRFQPVSSRRGAAGHRRRCLPAFLSVLSRCSMLKVTMPSPSSSASSSTAAAPTSGRSTSAAAVLPDYWIDGSNRDTLAEYYELESELGR